MRRSASRFKPGLLLFFQLFVLVLPAQQPMQLEISGTFQQRSAPEILYVLQQEYPVRFYYYPRLLPAYPQSHSFRATPLLQVMEEVLSGTNLEAINYDSTRIIIVPRMRRDKAYAEELIRQWDSGAIELPLSNETRVLEYALGDSTATPPTAPLRLSGRITEARSGAPAIGAAIAIPGTPIGAAADENGYYELELPAGRHELLVQYIGFQTVLLDLSIYASGSFDLSMEFQALSLGEVVVEATADDRNLSTVQAGVEELSPTTIRKLPSFMGEADVVRSLTLLPGVNTVGEGAAGFNVRGGNIDQNLILQDGAPIFNSAHALGFFSIFNADAIEGVTLFKGNIPAQYGGRSSSVLDIDLREGDRREFHGKGGIGFVSSRLLLEGPTVPEKGSFLIGGRASYSDWILRSVRNPDVRQSSARFHDLTAKIDHQFGDRTRVGVTGYHSFDLFRYSDEFGYDWSNLLLSGYWSQLYSDRFSSELTVAFGSYDTRQFDPEGNDAFNLYGGLEYYRVKQNFVYQPTDAHLLHLGAEWQFQDTYPERIEPGNEESTRAPREVEKDQGHELALYLNDEWTLTPALTLSLGLRWSFFLLTGPRTVFRYAPDQPRLPSTITDTIVYGAGERIQQYGGLEPRLSLRLRLSAQDAVKFSFNRLRQYAQLVSNTTVATPVDIWQLSTPYVPPLISDNLSLGFFHNWGDNTWEASIEGYYRWMDHLLSFRDLADLLLNEHLETELLSGRGRAYGLEFSLRKRLGSWTGWFSYTYSRSLAQVAGDFPETTINGGRWFPAPFDQPHQLSMVSKWQFNPKSSLTVNFVYNSGRPVTAPVGGYFLGNTYVPNFSDRNDFRIADYHRMDLAYTYDNSLGRSKGFRGSFTIGIYNLYFRNNAFSVFFQRDENDIPQAFQLSLLGTALPYVTYNFVF